MSIACKLLIGVEQLNAVDCAVWGNINVHFGTDFDRLNLFCGVSQSNISNVVSGVVG
jgi:hypothetical protein